MAGFKGDLSQLDQLRKMLRELGDVVPETASAVVPELQAQIERTVASGSDPYGNAFAPLKDGGAPLQGLTKPAKVQVVGNMISVSVTRATARYAHRGRKAEARGGFMPRRPLVPPGEDAPIPKDWAETIEQAAQKLMDAKTKTKG